MSYISDDYQEVQHLLRYPERLDRNLNYFTTTNTIELPENLIDRVIFQEKAKEAIRKVSQNKGHLLLIGKPGTGKSFLADMFESIFNESMGEYIKPKKSILAIPGKDRNHVHVVYIEPDEADSMVKNMWGKIEAVNNSAEDFTLADEISLMNKGKKYLILGTLISVIIGLFFPMAFVLTGLLGIGSIFLHMQESNYRVQERLQKNRGLKKTVDVKKLVDMMPELLFDPRKEKKLMARVAEPDTRNMKGGFRHDPYQSGRLETPAHKRAYLGAHAKSPIIYIDELKTLIKRGYMPELLEIMQNKEYILEGGTGTGSGTADRSDNEVKAENIFIACCNHDTYAFLRSEGDGAFLSRIEDKGQIIEMESAVPETPDSLEQVVQYVKQEIINLEREFVETWQDIIKAEGYEGVRKRSEKIYGRSLPQNYVLRVREFSRDAIKEVVKELRSRTGTQKLSAILRPINGIIKEAELEAIFSNSELVQAHHVQSAIKKHVSLEGAMTEELIKIRKNLKKYLDTITDSIGYVVGLAVFESSSSGQMYGNPMPIRCQINVGGQDKIITTGKLGEIAKEAAENVRASIRKIFETTQCLYTGYEMHIQYIQAHGGVEGDSASLAMDMGLISDYIKQPVNQKFGVTGSLTGDIALAVGGVTEKVRSIMDTALGMEGACVPWQNKNDIEPLLINMEAEYIIKGEIPGIRIYREPNKSSPFDIYFCKTKYHAYEVMMDLKKEELLQRMAERSMMDFELVQRWRSKLEKIAA
jgi:Lon-like ATP-dependent protease